MAQPLAPLPSPMQLQFPALLMVTAALVTAGTLVDVTDATVTISDTPTITELNNIAAKTTGVVTATLAEASLPIWVHLILHRLTLLQ